MIAYYIERGHPVQELLNLSATEKMFYKMAKQVACEEVNAIGK